MRPYFITTDICVEQLNNYYEEELALLYIEDNIEHLNLCDWDILAKNKNAIHLLEKNINSNDLQFWYNLSRNPNAINLLKKNMDKVNLDSLAENYNKELSIFLEDFLPVINKIIDYNFFSQKISRNPYAIDFLNKYPEFISWITIWENYNAVDIIEKNKDKINICSMSNLVINKNPKIVKYIESYIKKNINEITQKSSLIRELSINPNTIHILEKYKHLIDYDYLSANPKAMHLIEKNLDKINWWRLCQNPNALHLLEKNINEKFIYEVKNLGKYSRYIDPNEGKEFNKIDWKNILYNPNKKVIQKIGYLMNKNIFDVLKLDYDKMKRTNSSFNKELKSKVFNQQRLLKICNEYNIELYELMNIYL